MVIGIEPSAVQKKYAQAARESFYAGVSQARPERTAKPLAPPACWPRRKLR